MLVSSFAESKSSVFCSTSDSTILLEKNSQYERLTLSPPIFTRTRGSRATVTEKKQFNFFLARKAYTIHLFHNSKNRSRLQHRFCIVYHWLIHKMVCEPWKLPKFRPYWMQEKCVSFIYPKNQNFAEFMELLLPRELLTKLFSPKLLQCLLVKVIRFGDERIF